MAEFNLTPVFRMEMFIDAIINGTTPPEPHFREEFYLAKMAGMDVEVPEPFTRRELYLAYMVGMDVSLPTPVTRDEMYLAEACGMDVTAPDPVFRDEFWLDELKAGEGEEYQEFTGKIIQFFASRAAAIKKMEVTLEPIQDLHGQDAPYPAGGGKNKFDIQNFWANAIRYAAGSEAVRRISVKVPANSEVTCSTNVPNNTNPNVASVFINNDASDSMPASSVAGVFLNAPRTITSNADGFVYINIRTESSSYLVWDETSFAPYYIQVELGTSATPYKPFANICPITGHTGAEVYDDPKYGGLINWNQIFKSVYSSTLNGVTYTAIDDGHINLDGDYNGNVWYRPLQNTPKSIVDHVYYVDKGIDTLHYVIYNDSSGVQAWETQYGIGKATAVKNFYQRFETGASFNNVTITPQIIDITQMFGSAVADQIYAMEIDSQGAGVAYFKSLFPKDYYPYNAGEELNVGAVNGEPYRHLQITFPDGLINQWDEEWENGTYSTDSYEKLSNANRIRCKNAISVSPDTSYYFFVGSNVAFRVIQYDENMNILTYGFLKNEAFTTEQSCSYITIHSGDNSYGQTYKNDISINYPATAKVYYPYHGCVFYGCTIDFVSGLMTVDKAVITDFANLYIGYNIETGIIRSFYVAIPNTIVRKADTFVQSSLFKSQPLSGTHAYDCEVTASASLINRIYFSISNIDYPGMTAVQAQQFLIDNNVQFLINLATPIEIQLTPQQISSLRGMNNIWSNSNGDLAVIAFGREVA